MRELTVTATVENIDTVTDFVNEYLAEYDCPLGVQSQIDIAIDELFGNIAHYAYGTEGGFVTVQIEGFQNPLAVSILFIDEGTPFDPLAKEDPDTGISGEEREVGGLGIFMVKKIMDAVSYEYVGKENRLKITKRIKGIV